MLVVCNCCQRLKPLASVLTGKSRWQLGHNRPKSQPLGTYIFHESDVPHAMETSAEPLLTVWAWMGDLEPPILFPAAEWLPKEIEPPRRIANLTRVQKF